MTEFRWKTVFGGRREECRDKDTKKLLGAVFQVGDGKFHAMTPGTSGRNDLGGFATAKDAMRAVEQGVVHDAGNPEPIAGPPVKPRRR